MKHVIIGTAGHVDHGKTALIKALTGTDTDRLEEEKKRGISIDLGFASLKLSDDITAGIVDVPGHERFLKNMLAGTGGIDMVMLIIAADEGVMPQTREHLAMLELLGIKHGIVVLNKIDKVDEDWLEMVTDDIRQLLAKTFLADAPLCRASAITGAGLDQLKQTLLAVASKLNVRDSKAPFRLWIDRSFSVKGHGAVVTGSALSGSVSIGDSLMLYPLGSSLRVRGLEWHGAKVEKIYAGQRSAINLSGGDSAELWRGMVLSSPARGVTSETWDVVAEWKQEVASGTRIRLHIGTCEVLGKVHNFKNQTDDYVRLILEKPLTVGLGDRGIIRQYSPQYLLGGAVFIAPGRQSRKMSADRLKLAKAVQSGEIEAISYALIEDGGQPMTIEEIRLQSGYYKDELINQAMSALLAAKKIVRIGGYYLTGSMLDALTAELTGLIGEYHDEQPERKGLSKEILRQKLNLKEKPFEILLSHWQSINLVSLSGAEVALQEFAARHSDWRSALLLQASEALDDIGLTSVDLALLMEKLQLPQDKARSAQDVLVKEGLLVKVGELLLLNKTITGIAKLVRQHLKDNPSITVAELRDMLDTSRKVALPLLEYFDMNKYTIREGDKRRPGPKMKEIQN